MSIRNVVFGAEHMFTGKDIVSEFLLIWIGIQIILFVFILGFGVFPLLFELARGCPD